MVVFFFILQAAVLKLPRTKIIQILFGIVYTFVGLVLFLAAVSMGFMPVGFKIGTQLAARSPQLLVLFAFVLGMVVVLAEPAVHVLNNQVEEITGGEVSRRQMMLALSIGVGVSIGLSVLRVRFGFSLLYYLIPGYLISLGLSFFVPRLYTAIAFDSGGVASGPLTSSFILPLVIGACYRRLLHPAGGIRGAGLRVRRRVHGGDDPAHHHPVPRFQVRRERPPAGERGHPPHPRRGRRPDHLLRLAWQKPGIPPR